MNIFNFLRRIVRRPGVRNKYALKEIKEDGNLRAAVLLPDDERVTLSKAERLERFKRWHKAEE
jgi:hypothetical protein